jgi:hypothetical protein
MSGAVGGAGANGNGIASGSTSARVVCNSSSLTSFSAAANCTDILGDLTLTSFPDLPNNASLPQLQTVSGSLVVQGTYALSSVSLPSLTVVGGSLSIARNPALTYVSLPLLARIEGNLSVVNNTALVVGLDFAPPSLSVAGPVTELSNVAAVEVRVLSTTFNISCSTNSSGVCDSLQNTGCAGYTNITSTGQCDGPVSCPANSAGTSVVLGCAVAAGYSGNVTATAISPFYNSTLAGGFTI